MLLSICFLICVCLGGSRAASPVTLAVETKSGPVVGFVKQYNGQDILHFYGIPYAEPPVGSLRFKKPVEKRSWTKVLEAFKPGPACIQAKTSVKDVHLEMSEDCLYLNIIETKDSLSDRKAKKRPVMVFIHGGSFRYGSGAAFPYLSDVFVQSQDVILVTINYRLNIFGFLYHEKVPEFIGNQGLWDQNMAFRWVKEHIGAFGGDPEDITIFGESAGSISCSHHLVSPHSPGLFKKAILQSGVGLLLQDKSNLRVTLATEIVLNRTGCAYAGDKLKCLQSIDPMKLEYSLPTRFLAFSPIYENEFIPVSESRYLLDDNPVQDVDVLVGITRDDASVFYARLVPRVFAEENLSYQDGLEIISISYKKEAVPEIAKVYFDEPTSDGIRSGLILMFTDIFFGCGTFEFAKRYSKKQKKGNVFTYILNHRPLNSHRPICTLDRDFGVCHEDDLIFMFGAPFMSKLKYSDTDRELSAQMMDIWGTFAHKGQSPLPGENRSWPSWNARKDREVTPAVLLAPGVPKKLDFNRPNFCVQDFDFIKRSLIPKLNWLDEYPVEEQILEDKKGTFKGFLNKLIYFESFEHE